MKTCLFISTKTAPTLLALAAALTIAVAAATEWTFNTDGDYQGWTFNQELAGSIVKDGALTGVTSGKDPFFAKPSLSLAASEVSSVTVRMKIQTADGQPVNDPGKAQLFWTTVTEPDCTEEASIPIKLIGDGEWHDYTIDVAGNENWRGTVTMLRLDPCSRIDVQVSVASVQLSK
ncbi:MAG: hypothetical protein D4R65_07350 [Verrucomicrobiaceae bacterium]|nr:MAG: hypothetical protein D4R65_07350 [Verrucomicrobiaceae bacterium]